MYQSRRQVVEQLGIDIDRLLEKLSAGSTLSSTDRRIGFRILVVNDPNNLYSPQNQTAEQLAQLADRLNQTAVMGHYSRWWAHSRQAQ